MLTRRAALAGALLATAGGCDVSGRSHVTVIDDTLSYPEDVKVGEGEAIVCDINLGSLVRYDAQPPFRRLSRTALAGCKPAGAALIGEGQTLALCHLEGKLQRLSNEASTSTGGAWRRTDGRLIPTPNDVAADGAGGAFLTSAGEFDPAAPPTGAVLHMAPDMGVTTLMEGLHYANGLAYDVATGTLFVTEHFTGLVWRMTVTRTGDVRDRRVFADFARLPAPHRGAAATSGPDNPCIRSNGNLVVPQYGAGRLVEFRADGRVERLFETPCRFVTAAAESGRRILFTGSFGDEAPSGQGMLGEADGLYYSAG